MDENDCATERRVDIPPIMHHRPLLFRVDTPESIENIWDILSYFSINIVDSQQDVLAIEIDQLQYTNAVVPIEHSHCREAQLEQWDIWIEQTFP